MGHAHPELPAHWNLLLHGIAFSEVADKSESTEARRRQLIEFCSRYKERLWIGLGSWELCGRPMRKPRRPRLSDLIYPRIARFRSELAQRPQELVERLGIAKSQPIFDDYRRSIDAFQGLTHAFRTRCAGAKTDEQVLKIVQDPEIITEQIVLANGGPRLSRAQCRRFPDRFAFTRWLRILLFYCLVRSQLLEGSKKDLGLHNASEDAEYLLLASFTGHIATADKLLQRAARVIVPGIRIYEWDHQGKQVRRC